MLEVPLYNGPASLGDIYIRNADVPSYFSRPLVRPGASTPSSQQQVPSFTRPPVSTLFIHTPRGQPHLQRAAFTMDYSLSPHERAVTHFNSVMSSTTVPGATEDYRDGDQLAYALSKVPMLTPRRLRVVAVGAGFGGVDLARSVKVGKIPGVDLTVYEKNAGVGGTWHENR